MRVICCLLVSTLGVLAQTAGAPIFTHAGPLACGLRPYTPGTVQEWCFYLNAPNPPKTICNALHVIAPVNAGDSLPVAASQSCFATDVQTGNIYAVSWLVWQPILALPPGSTGTVQYQIASTVMPCALNSFGACVSTAPGISTFQEGSFSSGVLNVAGIVTVQDGAESVNWMPQPGAQWQMDNAGALAVISTAGFAQAVGPGAFCRATSDGGGIAQFAMTDRGLKVGWLPDGWCPGGLNVSPPLSGSCSALAFSSVFHPDGSCSASPVERASPLVSIPLGFLPLAPTVQGR